MMKRYLMMLIFAVVANAQRSTHRCTASANDKPWFRREKVRCLSYLYADEQSLSYVPRVKPMGFNCALALVAGAPVERILPLVNAADKANLRLILVDYWDNKKYLAEGVVPKVGTPRPFGAEQPRRFVGPDGRVSPHLPCPTDARFYQAGLGQRALELARLRRAGHAAVCGLLLDIEDYAGTGDLPCGGTWFCTCDQCFGGFMQSAGKGGTSVPAAQRQSWLSDHNLGDSYRKFQDDAVVSILSDIRQQLDKVAPDFLLAVYPWTYVEPADRRSRVAWDIRFARGLGTDAAPFMLFDERTYVWGYDPAMERQQADLRAQGLRFLAVTGFNMIPAERLWFPEQMAASAYWASRRSDGYWIYVGHWALLDAPAGRDVSGVWGDRPEAWVKEFTAVNRTIASGKAAKMPLLSLPPLQDCFQLTDLYNPKHAPGAPMFVRRWSEIGLPWEGGELVVLGNKAGGYGLEESALSFQHPVSRTERYEISVWLTTGPDRAVVQLEVDGKPVGEPIDLYRSITTPGEKAVLGTCDLESGNHTFRLIAVGKNERSSGYHVGLRAMDVDRIGYPPQSWSVIGPFDNTGEDLPGYDAVYPPEQGVNLEATYPGKGSQPVRWRQVKANPDGYLDLLPLFSERKEAVAYCLTYIYSPTDGPRTLLLGSDDGGKLFVNGECVWGEPKRRSARRDENTVRAHFRRGWNEVLFKVVQATGGWGIYFRVHDPKRELTYAPVRPLDERG